MKILRIVEFNIPYFSNVNHINTIRASLPQVWLHVNLQILGAKMTACSQQHLNVLRSSIECLRKIGWRHLEKEERVAYGIQLVEWEFDEFHVGPHFAKLRVVG